MTTQSRWLLSGHNPRESLGISFPITNSWFTDFANQQLAYVVGPLVGGVDQLDLSIPTMTAVRGQAFVNVSCLNRNIALAVPFDPAAFGAPKGLLPERKPKVSTLLLLPFRLTRIYRRTMDSYRRVVPAYREILFHTYWQMRASNGESTEQNPAEIGRLFEAGTVEMAKACSNFIMFVGMLNSGIVGIIKAQAPVLLNLLVGQNSATAQLGNRMWRLREIAEQCGESVLQLLRAGEMDLDKYRAIPQAAPFLEALADLMQRYGYRSFHYASQLESIRMADQMDLVLLTVAGLLHEKEPPTARVQAVRELGRQALHRMNRLQRFLWMNLLRWGSGLVERREELRDLLELQSATYGLAARLLSRHYFPKESRDYLWLYTFDEFLAFGQSRGQQQVDPKEIARRRAALAEYRAGPELPELIWYDPQAEEWWPVEGTDRKEERRPAEGVDAVGGTPGHLCLQGIGASAGREPVEGPALVVDDVRAAASRLFDMTGPVILITHMTDPIWSSLFPRLTAVVTEMGGVISHAAVVAREYGIPAVVGLAEVTRRIRDGQWVRVDGARGTVEVIGVQ